MIPTHVYLSSARLQQVSALVAAGTLESGLPARPLFFNNLRTVLAKLCRNCDTDFRYFFASPISNYHPNPIWCFGVAVPSHLGRRLPIAVYITLDITTAIFMLKRKSAETLFGAIRGNRRRTFRITSIQPGVVTSLVHGVIDGSILETQESPLEVRPAQRTRERGLRFLLLHWCRSRRRPDRLMRFRE
jgi:hypothetical protein